MPGYFSNFPIVKYESDNSSSTARNILLRGTMRDEAKRLILEILEIKPGDRADYLAHLLYNNPEFDYLFYLLNDIVDPYYEWQLTGEELDLYLDRKYGDELYSPKHYKKITTKLSLATISIRDGGTGYANNDTLTVGNNEGSRAGTARIFTDVSGTITNFTLVSPGSNITRPEQIVFRRAGVKINNNTANIIPIIEDFNGEDLIINTETYDMLDDKEQIKYLPVTNKEHEDEKNYERRLFNAVRPEIAQQIQSQMKKLLAGIK